MRQKRDLDIAIATNIKCVSISSIYLKNAVYFHRAGDRTITLVRFLSLDQILEKSSYNILITLYVATDNHTYKEIFEFFN